MGGGLTRGTYVIMNDIDRPAAMLVAVLTRYDDKRGIWHALYLAKATNMAAPYGPAPTPIERFARRVEWMEGHEAFRIVSMQVEARAKYRDGRSRQWQDGDNRWWLARTAAANACQKWAHVIPA